MGERELVCIVCPASCTLKVRVEPGGEIKVEGAMCPRGVNYAREEVTNPRRTVFSVVEVEDGDLPTVSVKTGKPVPKACVQEVMKLTAAMKLRAPVDIGQVVAKDVCGADIVATRRVKRRAPEPAR